MRSCLHSVSLPDLPILEVLEQAKAYGYGAVELNAETLPWARPHVTPNLSAAERRQLVEAAQRLGLTLPAIGAHIPMVGDDPAERVAALDFAIGCIDLAADLGVPIVHILSGPLQPATDKQTAWPWFADAVTEVTGHAETKTVILAIEAIAGHMFCSVDDYHRLRTDLPGINFRINFDPSHLIVQGENPMRVIDDFADEIVNVHLKDGSGHFPDFKFPPLGQGEIDFLQLTSRLRESGYRGAMSVEYEAQVYGFAASDQEILQGGRDYLTKLQVA